ncbi:MAG: TldD/PmbA family protein [Turicibacter sp.]|nr:TldD/PmbA family protein [Turicibacter sp.]
MLDFNRLFEAGKRAGLLDMEVYFVEDENFSCKVFEGEVDSYAVSATRGLSFRGIYNGKMGYTYTEKADDSSIPFLVESAVENARLIEKDDVQEIYGGDSHYETLELYDARLEAVEAASKIDFLKQVEEIAKSLDDRIKSVNYNAFANGVSNVRLVNSKGLDLSQKANYAYTYVSVLASVGGENKTAGGFIVSQDFSKYDPKEFAARLVGKAVAKLGSTKPKSAMYPVLLHNLVAGDLLEAMSGSFSAESVKKDLSRLKDRLGETIASTALTIMDDPHLDGGMGSAAFDGEGVATFSKYIIYEGKLLTYLHSLSTAKHFGVKSTGNGFRSGFKGPVSIGPSNMYVLPGEKSFDELVRAMGNGIFITDIQGLHAGLNGISGDFSLSANGFLVEDGKVGKPVHEITIAGNFFDMLGDIQAIGSDLDFGASSVGSPSIWVGGLSVAGE